MLRMLINARVISSSNRVKACWVDGMVVVFVSWRLVAIRGERKTVYVQGDNKFKQHIRFP